MKRDADYFQIGSTYNRQYFGGNEAYKKQNGQTTFRITAIEGDKIRCKDLFACHPSNVESPELTGNEWTWTLSGLLESQKEYTYSQVFENEFFIHSQKMTVAEAVKAGLISPETIERVFRNQSSDFMRVNPVACHSRWMQGENNFFSLTLNAEQGISDNPYLQTIVFVWASQDEMETDVKSVFPDAWFM